jgi:uncharacterized protein (DUF2235 family)
METPAEGLLGEEAMPRNIVVFADGTGQRGGIFFDENRSNIYKLYRATRCGPEYSVNPAEQLAFYDPGVGTDPIEGNVSSGYSAGSTTSSARQPG